jgi:hypothetical protein
MIFQINKDSRLLAVLLYADIQTILWYLEQSSKYLPPKAAVISADGVTVTGLLILLTHNRPHLQIIIS